VSGATAGSGSPDSAGGSNTAILPAGSEGKNPLPAAATAPASSRGRPGQCERYREQIQAKLDQQLTAQRIWQDLVAEQGFTGSYDSVKRYVRGLGQRTPLPFRRMACGPGEEAQVDFGTGAPVITPDGKRRKTVATSRQNTVTETRSLPINAVTINSVSSDPSKYVNLPRVR
jgi:hypothetical protein